MFSSCVLAQDILPIIGGFTLFNSLNTLVGLYLLFCIAFNYAMCVMTAPGPVPAALAAVASALSSSSLSSSTTAAAADSELSVRLVVAESSSSADSSLSSSFSDVQPLLSVPVMSAHALFEKHNRMGYCNKCDKPKPPRTHHCHLCRKCVLRMDHHCPVCCVAKYGVFSH